MAVADPIWRSQTQSYLRPLPQRLGVTPRGRSKRLQRVLTDFGCEQSFARAAASVLEHYGFEMGASAVRATTLGQAQRAREQLQEQYEQSFRVLPAVGADYVIAQADGTMICTVEPAPRKAKHPREWKEMRLVATQALGSTTTVYGATFGSVAEVGQRWGHCARQAGWGLNSHIHAMGDGADWIRLQSREVFGLQATFLCDFFHVTPRKIPQTETMQHVERGPLVPGPAIEAQVAQRAKISRETISEGVRARDPRAPRRRASAFPAERPQRATALSRHSQRNSTLPEIRARRRAV